MDTGLEDTEREVVVASNGNQRYRGNDHRVEPREYSVLRSNWRHHVSIQWSDCAAHIWPRTLVYPPLSLRGPGHLPHWLDAPTNMLVRCLIERCLTPGSVGPEVDHPGSSCSRGDVLGVHKGANHPVVPSAVWIWRIEEPPCFVGGKIKGTTKRDALESDSSVAWQPLRLRQVDAGREVAIDRLYGSSVEFSLLLGTVVLGDKADMNVGSGQDPPVVGSSKEDVACLQNPSQDELVRSASDVLRGQ